MIRNSLLKSFYKYEYMKPVFELQAKETASRDERDIWANEKNNCEGLIFN